MLWMNATKEMLEWLNAVTEWMNAVNDEWMLLMN